MQKAILQLIIFIASLFLLLGMVGYQVQDSYQLTAGKTYIYPIDDPYIHITIAKNLATHGTWGINPVEQAGASSSILYTLILAVVFKIFGIHILTPVILNLIFAILLLYVVYLIGKKHLTTLTYALLSFSMVLFPPLTAMVILGMEHSLHLLTVAYFSYLLISLADDKPVSLISLGIIIMLCVATRYESLFLMSPVCLVLLWKKEYKLVALFAISSVIPLVLYGVYSTACGGFFVPNTLLVKGNTPTFDVEGLLHFVRRGLDKINHNAHIKALFDVLWIGFLGTSLFHFKKETYFTFTKWHAAFLTLLITLLLQVCFADIGWFFRYEAYFITLMLIFLLYFIDNFIQNWQSFTSYQKTISFIMSCVLYFYANVPLFHRFLHYQEICIQAMTNIYEQQYQMAQFIHQYYDHSTIIIGDIGAISYYSQANILDVNGLGTNEVVRKKKTQSQEVVFTQLIKEKKVQMGILYKRYLPMSALPLQEVGEWTISNNRVCADSTVTFYSTDSVQAKMLKQNLSTFSRQLPKSVRVSTTQSQ